MASRTPPQPAITGPLQKRDRDLLVGEDATAGEGSADEPHQASPDLPAEVVRSPEKAPQRARATKRNAGANPTARAAEADAGDAAGSNDTGDPLLASLLAGRSPGRGIPITRLEPELHSTLRLISARTGVPIQELVNGAVRQWLQEHQQRLIDGGVLEP